jgi:hypothetical protein
VQRRAAEQSLERSRKAGPSVALVAFQRGSSDPRPLSEKEMSAEGAVAAQLLEETPRW